MDIVDIFFSVGGICIAIVAIIRKKRLERIEDDIIKTRIVDVRSRSRSTTHTSTSSALKCAAVGGALFGKRGAEYGAYTAKRRTITEEDDIVVFKVWWSDGDKTIEKVKRGSGEYELYLEYLED